VFGDSSLEPIAAVEASLDSSSSKAFRSEEQVATNPATRKFGLAERFTPKGSSQRSTRPEVGSHSRGFRPGAAAALRNARAPSHEEEHAGDFAPARESRTAAWGGRTREWKTRVMRRFRDERRQNASRDRRCLSRKTQVVAGAERLGPHRLERREAVEGKTSDNARRGPGANQSSQQRNQ
jgi:hypothetical protein